jgi:hypothetical protein
LAASGRVRLSGAEIGVTRTAAIGASHVGCGTCINATNNREESSISVSFEVLFRFYDEIVSVPLAELYDVVY